MAFRALLIEPSAKHNAFFLTFAPQIEIQIVYSDPWQSLVSFQGLEKLFREAAFKCKSG